MASIRAGVAYVDILPNFTKFNAAMQKNLSTTSRKMALIGATVTRYVTLPIIAAGAAAVKTSVSFEASMAKIEGLAGVAAGEVDKMREAVLKLAPTVGKGPQELADALYFITSSGFKSSEALYVLEASAKAATAGLGDTQTIADAVTSAINAYGRENLNAAQATDILVAGVREGKGEADDLANVIGRVIPIAAEMGVEFDQVTAAVASMTLGGLSAAEAVTALRQFLVLMLKPAQQSRKVLEDVGLTADDVAALTDRLNISMAKGGFTMDKLRQVISEQGLFEGMNALKQALGDNADAIGRGIPNVRALAGFLNITGKNAERNSVVFDKLAHSAGSMDTAFKIAQRTAKFKLNQALAQLQVTGVEVGNILIPIVTRIAQKFGQYAESFRKLPAEKQKLIVKILALTAAVGPLLLVMSGFIKIIQLVVGGIAGAIRGIGSFINGMRLLGEAFNVSTAAAAAGTIAYAAALTGILLINKKIQDANKATADSFLNQTIPALLRANSTLEITAQQWRSGPFGGSDVDRAADVFKNLSRGIIDSTTAFYNLANIAGVTNEQIAETARQLINDAIAAALTKGTFAEAGGVINQAMERGIIGASELGITLLDAGAAGAQLAAILQGVNQAGRDGIMIAYQNAKAWREGSFIGPVTAEQRAQLDANRKAFEASKAQLSTGAFPKLPKPFGKGGLPGGVSKGASERKTIADRLREALQDLDIPKFKNIFKKALEAALPAASEAMEGLRDRLRTLTEAATDAARKGLISDSAIKKLKGLNRTAASLSARLSALVDRMNEFNNSIKSGFDKFSDFSDILEHATPQAIMADFAKRAASAKQFADLLTQAAKRGLSPEILAQVAQAGPQGIQFLQSLQSLSAEQIKQLNAQQAQIGKLRQQTIAALDKQYFGPAFKKLAAEINKFASSLGKFASALAKIIRKIAPNIKLATGGIVTSPTIALIGEGGPEAVVPLNVLSGMMGGRGGDTYITVEGSIVTQKEIERIIRESYLTTKRRNTRVGLG